MTAREFLALCDGVRRSGDGWIARCKGPKHAHGDVKPSLSVTETEDRILLRCHTGCGNEEIVAAMRLTMADLFLRPRELEHGNGQPAPERRLVKAYRYEDVDGTLLYENCRYEPKDFRQRRPDGQGGYTWTLRDVKRVLYRLPELAEQRRVFLVEGEKDADNLWAEDLPATTVAGGAKSWRPEYAEQLRSAGVDQVIILPDNDEPGRAYAAQAAAALRALGLRVKVVRLPDVDEKGDVTDWLAIWPNSGEDLVALVETAPDYESVAPMDAPTGPPPLGIGLGVFLAIEDPDVEAYVDGVLSADGGGWIAGEEKLGKTYYADDEALCLALGLPVCGRFNVPQRRRVLFIEEEDSPRRTRSRLRALLVGHGFDPKDQAVRAELNGWFHLEAWSGFSFDNPAMVTRLEAAIATFEPSVVYVDVLRKVTLRDLNKADQAGALLQLLDNYRRKYGVLFRIIHHYRKSQGFRVGRGSQELGGSFVLGAWAENSLFFEPMGRKQGAGVKVEIQMKDGAPEPAFLLEMTAEGPRHAPTKMVLTAKEISEKAASSALREKILEALGTLPKTSPDAGKAGVQIVELALAVDRSERTLRGVLKDLREGGLIDVVGKGRSKAGKPTDLYARVPGASS